VVVLQPGAIKPKTSDVLLEPVRDRARGTAYPQYVEGFAKVTPRLASIASDTKVVIDVLESSNPSRRYVAGSMAKPVFFEKTWCGDRGSECHESILDERSSQRRRGGIGHLLLMVFISDCSSESGHVETNFPVANKNTSSAVFVPRPIGPQDACMLMDKYIVRKERILSFVFEMKL